MKKYIELNRYVAQAMTIVLMFFLVSGNISNIRVLAAEGEYPYMMLAASGEEGAITLSANNVGINGSVATNGSIVTIGGNVNINGNRTEKLGNPDTYIGMPDIGAELETAYFSAGVESFSEDYSLEETNININSPMEGEGSIELTGNITLNAGVMADEDIVFCGEVKNTGEVVIYSATGDVVIESTNVNVNGLIYAPQGEIYINSMNLNMNNVILIAEKITIIANGINGGRNQNMAAFIGADYAVIGEDADGEGESSSVSGNEGENPSVSDNEGEVSDNSVSENNITDGIVVLESSFEGGYEGQIYYKEVTSEEDIVVAANGLQCVKNQMILSASEGIRFEEVEESLAEYGAVIVGFIEATNDYQVEFIHDKDVNEMETLIQTLTQESWVLSVGYNYIWLEEPEFTTTDPWAGDIGTDWDSSRPEDSNWGVETIRLEEALRAAGVIQDTNSGTIIDTSGLTPVRLGVIDNAFDIWHEDLEGHFVADWNNYLSLEDLESALLQNERLDHGTHVAGTMAAGFNNGIGITGVCVENEILAFSLVADTSAELGDLIRDNVSNNEVGGNSEEESGAEDVVMEASTYKVMCALGVLICNDVKVINYSYGLPVIDFVHSQSTEDCSVIEDTQNADWRIVNACNYLTEQTAYIRNYLDELLNNGYDFLIVCAAGNVNGESFYQCEEEISLYGYIKTEDYDVNNLQHVMYVDNSVEYNATNMNINVQARYNSVFNNISNESECYNHILCVGALDYPTGYPRGDVSYRMAGFSCVGDRVDILAPGVDIYSCGVSENYVYKDGTSMAAPQVAGALGLALNVNPDIEMVQLKQLLIASGTCEGLDYPVLNVENLVRAVQDCAVVQIHLTDENGNVFIPENVEVHRGGTFFHYSFGGTMEADAVENKLVCETPEVDADGMLTVVVPRGTYHILVSNRTGNTGAVIDINISDEDIGTICEYNEQIDTFDSANSSSVRFQVRYPNTNRVMDNVTLSVYRGYNSTAGGLVQEITLGDVYHFTINMMSMSLPYGAYTVVVTDANGSQTKSNLIVDREYLYSVLYHVGE